MNMPLIIAALVGVAVVAVLFAVWRAYRKGRGYERVKSLALQAEGLVHEQARQRKRERVVLSREREIARGVSAARTAKLLQSWPDSPPS